jgi:hypothetical protein
MATTPLVFVFGTGRCGTHTLWKLFESLPNTLSTHEGNGTIRAGPAELIGKQITMGEMWEYHAFLYHAANEVVFRRTFAPDQEIAALMERSFGNRSKLIEWCAAQGLAYCDANPFAYNFIDYLQRKYPHAKFIHLVRDGYACVRSWFRRETTYPDHLPDLRRITWMLAKPVPFASEPVHAAWQTFDRVQRISWFWSSVNANIIERFTRIPVANRSLLRIEDLSKETTPSILSFCGLSQNYAPEALAPDNASSGPTVEWTQDNVRKFNDLAGPMMRSLGYALR